MSDLKCWMCNGHGAVYPQFTWRDGRKIWQPFTPEPGEHVRLDRDEHICPACGGAGNPR